MGGRPDVVRAVILEERGQYSTEGKGKVKGEKTYSSSERRS